MTHLSRWHSKSRCSTLVAHVGGQERHVPGGDWNGERFAPNSEAGGREALFDGKCEKGRVVIAEVGRIDVLPQLCLRSLTINACWRRVAHIPLYQQSLAEDQASEEECILSYPD